jgi:ABC-type branched-subunit amino acid transport system permease subunit
MTTTTTRPDRPTRKPLRREPTGLRAPWVTRLVACLFGGFVLSLMVGSQEGSNISYSYGFVHAVYRPLFFGFLPRVTIFLVIGVLLFLAITFRPQIVPYLTRPGFWPFVSGSLAVLAAIGTMHWDDAAGAGKFGDAATTAKTFPDLAPVAVAFFRWLGWTSLIVIFVVGLFAIISGLRIVAFAVAVAAVASAVIVYNSHSALTDLTNASSKDHSLGYLAAILGYVVIAAAMLASALSNEEKARSKEFVGQVLGYRPGLPLVVAGVILTLLAFLTATWFSPSNHDATMTSTHDLFDGTGIASLALNYMAWLGWVLLAAAAIVAAAGCWLRHTLLSWAAALIGVVGSVLTIVTIYDISYEGAQLKVDASTGAWQNLGVGGWMAAAGLFLIGSAGVVAATAKPVSSAAIANPDPAGAPPPVTGSRPPLTYLSAPGATRSAILIAIAVALFYPPTASPFWQTVLVTEIGVAMLLAVGLNVVVGWAGLLDLGFIAFYALGSYTTAYFVGSLPKKPPHWLIVTPLLAIPFAIVVCLIAGVTLGAPTLRLRGDYLAIVTLGFGEIIYLAAQQAGAFTNGSEGITNNKQHGTKSIPHPSIDLGPLHIKWGLNPLQYWYLLLVFLVLILLLFRRLEHSRTGRAWAAIREDEVAAQATGINTTRTKLLAFSIGASSSGIAGVFFASQIGTFSPTNFVLNNSILIVAYVVFGGMGSITGAMAGAAALTWLPEFLKSQVPQADKLMWIGAIIILMMIFRPEGLIPARRRRIELSDLEQIPSVEPAAVPLSEGL